MAKKAKPKVKYLSLNGKVVPWAEANIHILSPAMKYAANVFEGIRGYWTTGDPAFGVVAPSATSGYVCTKYTIEGEKYSARFVPYPGTTPAFGTAIIT